MEFNINGTVIPQVEKYDNQGAHNAIKSMMQRTRCAQCHQVNDAEKRNSKH